MYWFTGFSFFVFGAILGSFGSLLVYRIPKKINFVSLGSFCDHCKVSLKWFENIPLFSWIFYRGKCRKCKKRIPFRYFFIEWLMGFLFLTLYLELGFSFLLLEYLILTFGLVVVSFIDLDHFILPDAFTLSGILIGLLGALFNPERSFLGALMGCVIGGGFLLIVAMIYFAWKKQEGVGGGDIKLLACMGAFLGLKSIPFIILVASVLGAVIGLMSTLKTKEGLKKMIPFGPYLSLGGVLYIFFGSQVVDWYLKLFILSSVH